MKSYLNALTLKRYCKTLFAVSLLTSSSIAIGDSTAPEDSEDKFQEAASLASVEEEVRHWFFDVYFNHWVDVGSGVRKEGPEFVLEYWGTPMFVTASEPVISRWFMTGEEIVEFLVMQHKALKGAGYSHTKVPDKNIFVYNENGAAIDVIWSRQASDNSEIQRILVHFEVAKVEGVWKVVGIQSRKTDRLKDKNSINEGWNQELTTKTK